MTAVTSEADDARLRRLLGSAELQTLRRRLRARYERGETRDAFTLSALTAAERGALESLLGRRARSATSITLSRSELDALVARAGLAADFRAALEALDGPLTDRKAERIARQSAWSALLNGVDEPRLRSLVCEAGGAALVKRLAGSDPARARALIERAQRVLAQLPAKGISLSQLAAESLGDAHALDAGQPVAALVLRVFRLGRGELTTESAAEAAAGDGRREVEVRRNQWARIGVSLNELAAPVLCLNLRARDETPAGMLAAAAAEGGNPVHLSLRALLRSPPVWDVADKTVYVCENSSVIATAADRFGRDCAPLICTDGMPGAAQQTLMRQLIDDGARLWYHGDFDWPGLTIGNFIVRNFGATPWRFGAADYRVAHSDVELPLFGRRVVAAWDESLADALTERDVAVHEEAVVETLLEDLEQRGRD